MDSLQTAIALLTEHLQYTPLSLIDDVIDSVNSFVYQGVGSLETGLFATPPERLGFKPSINNGENPAQTDPDSPEAKQEIEEGLHKLETLLNSTVDKNFDKFEIYVLRNILSVPQELVNWIRLSHYDVRAARQTDTLMLNGNQGIVHSPPTDTPTSTSIDLLRQKLAASRKVNKTLQTEKRRNDAILARLKNVVGPVVESSREPNFSFLNNSNAIQAFGNQSQKLTTNATFTVSQLPAMQAVLAALREQLKGLKAAPIAEDTAKDEMREERREYIEQRTQSLLQRTGQTIYEDSSATVGKVIDPSEIEALEKVAGSFRPT